MKELKAFCQPFVSLIKIIKIQDMIFLHIFVYFRENYRSRDHTLDIPGLTL